MKRSELRILIKEVISEYYGSESLKDIDIIKGETIISITKGNLPEEITLNCASGNSYDVFVLADEYASAEISKIDLNKIIGKPIVFAQHDDLNDYGVTLIMKTQDGSVGNIVIVCEHNGYYGFSYGVKKIEK